MKPFVFFLLVLLTGFSAFPQVQGEVKDDQATENLVKLAKGYLEKKDYISAAQTFEIASEKPLNTLSSYSSYMTGLSWFLADEPDKAKDWFNKFLREYPLSKYVHDAKYHKALILMNGEDNSLRELGIDMMFRVADKTPDAHLKRQALDAARHYLFNVYDEKFVNVYSLFVNDKNRAIVMEALCHHLAKNDEKDLINEKIDEYLKEGGKATRYMIAMKKEFGDGNIAMDDQINMAVFMPFYFNLVDTATSVPGPSARALELYIGMKMALDTLSRSYNRKIRIKIFDTRKDTFQYKELLDELEAFTPDLIVGDISTRNNIPLSRWAERNMVTQFILLNPSDNLVEGKNFVFLTHPAITTHGRKMAEYLYEQRGMKKIVGLYDSSPISSSIFASFKSSYDSLGGEIVEHKVSQVYDVGQKELEKIVKGLKYKSFDGVYAPFPSEEHAGLTLSLLNYHEIETKVFGSPDWEFFEAIDGDLKNHFQLTFSTFYFERNDSLAYEDLKFQYIQDYGNIPTKYVVQGYDIMNYLLKVAREINPFVPLADVFRGAPSVKTTHQDVEYDGHQDNQQVTILRYKDGRYIKVN